MARRPDSAITVGRIAGAPVRVGPGSVLIAGYIAFSLARQWSQTAGQVPIVIAGILTGVAFLASIVAHEAGHALMAKRLGIRATEIRLSLLGGAAALERGAPTPSVEMKVAAAGPAVNIVIGGLVFGGLYAFGGPGTSDLVVSALVWIGGINLILGVFNLLPGLPLDGGRVLTGFLWSRRNDRGSAVRTTAKVGRFLAILAFGIAGLELVFLGSVWGIYTAFIGYILLRGSDAEVAQAALVDQVKGQTVNDVASFEPPLVDESVNTAAARALLPPPSRSRWAVVRDAEGIARGLLDLIVLDRAANADGTDPVGGVMMAIDQTRAAYPSESLEEVIARGVLTPFVVINEKWQPVALVESLSGRQASPA